MNELAYTIIFIKKMKGQGGFK